MNPIVERIVQQAKKGNTRPFRNNFHRLSFADLTAVYEAVTPHFGPQRHFSYELVKQAAEVIELSGVVVELGSHDGSLAGKILEELPDITEWIGLEVCRAETDLVHPKYRPVILKDWFHRGEPIEADAFVSTHTLEHVDRRTAFDTLGFVFGHSRISKILLEMPFRPRGNWEGSRSMHVLEARPPEIAKALWQADFQQVYYGTAGMNHIWGAVR